MDVSYLFIMTLCFWLAESNKVIKKHVYNSIEPLPDNEPMYNISGWVKQLNLQQCVIVEVGESYCGVFVEHRITDSNNISFVEEYFLGLCDAATLRTWRYCPVELEKERPRECVFTENSEFSRNPTRVHRRLCDITGLSYYANPCDCTGTFGGQRLLEVIGFPTCFIPPLPSSICTPRNVCGIFSCNATTINQQIHSVSCNPHCIYGQPFCEAASHESTRASRINSFWSDWRDPIEFYTHTQDVIHSEAVCINKNTGLGAIDCLGPGTNCCPSDLINCKCHVYVEDGVLRLSRQFRIDYTTHDTTDYFNVLRPRRNIAWHKGKLSNGNSFSPKYTAKRMQKEEEYADDDDSDDDTTEEEDVLLEENDHETRGPTTETLEKDEIKKVSSGQFERFDENMENTTIVQNTTTVVVETSSVGSNPFLAAFHKKNRTTPKAKSTKSKGIKSKPWLFVSFLFLLNKMFL